MFVQFIGCVVVFRKLNFMPDIFMYVYAFARIEMSQSFYLDPLAAEMKTKLSGKVRKKW